MDDSEKQDLICAALVEAQSELSNIEANAEGHYGKYATLGDTLNTLRPIFAKHKLAILHLPARTGDKPGMEVRIIHSSGQCISGTTALEITEHNPQKFGSAWTYYRRYTIHGALGITAKGSDDDGQAASKSESTRQTKKVANVNSAQAQQDRSNHELESEVFTFGKFRDKHIADIPTEELVSYATYCDNLDKPGFAMKAIIPKMFKVIDARGSSTEGDPDSSYQPPGFDERNPPQEYT